MYIKVMSNERYKVYMVLGYTFCFTGEVGKVLRSSPFAEGKPKDKALNSACPVAVPVFVG